MTKTARSEMVRPMRPGLKEEYASDEWKAWRKKDHGSENAKFTAPKAPVEYVESDHSKLNCTALHADQISVIAVQGLAASYDWTWTKVLEDGSRVMWLRDLLPQDLPSARILTFEYDTKWLQNPSSVSLSDCADLLLESILWDRTHRGETKMCSTMASCAQAYLHGLSPS
jgi:hypothetical protein